MRLQAGIGRVAYSGRGDLNNQGQLVLAKVKRVNNKMHTAEVSLEQGSYVGPSNKQDEETVQCMILENSQGFSEEFNASYGKVTPLHEGQFVIVAYVDAMKKKPIIIGSIAPIDNSLTNQPTVNADGELEKEKDESYEVSKLQEYTYTTADGDFEKVKADGSFFTGRREKISDHRENGFLYDDLSLKNKWTYKTIRALKKFFDYKPLNYLIQTKNTFEDKDETVYNRFYHDSEKGVTRVSKDSKNKLFYMELDDGFSIVQQRDSNRRPRKSYEEDIYKHETLRKSDLTNINKLKKDKKIPDFQKINEFTSLKILEDGSLDIQVQQKESVTNINIGDQVSIITNKDINVNSKENINFYAGDTFKVRAPFIDLKETATSFEDPRKEDKENEWQQQWINPTKKNGNGI